MFVCVLMHVCARVFILMSFICVYVCVLHMCMCARVHVYVCLVYTSCMFVYVCLRIKLAHAML
jgi:hypothetical protein